MAILYGKPGRGQFLLATKIVPKQVFPTHPRSPVTNNLLNATIFRGERFFFCLCFELLWFDLILLFV